eukprot:3135631-Lingulodinium_polyedra.AAC.1
MECTRVCTMGCTIGPPVVYSGINCGAYDRLYSVESTIGVLVESTVGPRVESTVFCIVASREGCLLDSTESLRWFAQGCPQW